MSDPRQGFASASAVPRLALCPGSLQLARKPCLPRPPGEYAEMGTRIASYLEAARTKRPLPVLRPDEMEIAVDCQRRSEEIINRAKSAFSGAFGHETWFGEGMTWMTETRLWGTTSTKAKHYSGRFDWAGLNATQKVAIIIDDKSGWLPLPAADVNLQLRTLAVLAYRAWDVQNVVVALNPAHGKPTEAYYDRAALKASAVEIEGIIDRAEEPNAPRRPSPDACRYCPVTKTDCDKAMESLLNVTTGNLAGDWPSVLEQLQIAELVIKDLRAQAKALLTADPNAIPGWHMAPGDERTTITDPKAAFGKVSDFVTSDEWMGICSAPIGKATELFMARAGIKNKKTARAQLEARLEGLIEKKPNAPSLERKPEEKK